eukprot:COSAG01_NODE_545_length_15679_cov_68.030167_11_plen_108_part_00
MQRLGIGPRDPFVRGRCGPSRFSFLRSLEFILRLIYISRKLLLYPRESYCNANVDRDVVYGKTIINTPENAIGNVDSSINPSEPSASCREQPVRHHPAVRRPAVIEP